MRLFRSPAHGQKRIGRLRCSNRTNVLVQPGFYYDFESEAFLVLSLLTPPDIFAEGLRRAMKSIE